MPALIEPLPGEDLASFASRVLGDPSRFRDIADQNGGLNPLATLSPQLALLVPSQEELATTLEPALQSIRTGVSATIASATAQLQSYIPEVIRQAADINGIVGDIEGPLNQLLDQGVQAIETGRAQLVDWLLDKSPTQGTDSLQESRKV
jgi:hypothetical protein